MQKAPSHRLFAGLQRSSFALPIWVCKEPESLSNSSYQAQLVHISTHSAVSVRRRDLHFVRPEVVICVYAIQSQVLVAWEAFIKDAANRDLGQHLHLNLQLETHCDVRSPDTFKEECRVSRRA